MRKAQITIFIVLGIVVMIIFGMLFFVKRETSDIVLEKRINKIYGDFLSTTGIKEYISVCLERSTKDAVVLASLQGGKIYSYQVEGGYNLTSLNETIPFNYSGFVYNVSYGIKKPIPGFAGNLEVPYYPYSGSLVRSPAFKSPFAHYSYLYYPYTLTPLCNGYGPNYFNISNATYSCEVWDRLNQSIQDYMERFIQQKVKECVNFPQFVKETNYNISEENISTFVLIGDFDIFVILKYPISITIKNKPPTTRFLDFSKRIDIRLKKIHELAIHLIGLRSILKTKEPETESDNIFFNITRDDPNDCREDMGSYSFNEYCILEGMNVTKISDYCLNNPICGYLPQHYKYSDIVNITDTKSLIDGKPLTFLFVVGNRAPALDYTPNLDVKEGDEIRFFALDPDEDSLVYSINPSSEFTKTGENQFKAESIGTYNVKVNVSDNEGLYDYQEVTVKVTHP